MQTDHVTAVLLLLLTSSVLRLVSYSRSIGYLTVHLGLRIIGLAENAGHEIAGQNIDDSVHIRSTETRVAARHKSDAVSLPEQTHLAAVVYSCCRCRRWRGSRPSRCSRWCRDWWQVVCVILVAGGLVVVSHRLDYFLCAQAGDLSPICCDLPQSSNWSYNRHKRLLSLFRLRRLPLLS